MTANIELILEGLGVEMYLTTLDLLNGFYNLWRLIRQIDGKQRSTRQTDTTSSPVFQWVWKKQPC
jgi:hypothetical protein